MSAHVVTSVDAIVDPAREQELLDGFRAMNAGEKPDGLLRSDLQRGQGGAWRIQSTWRDVDALMAMRNSGKPASLALFDALGAPHSHAAYTIEQTYNH